MFPKLLSQSEIAQKKSSEKRREIEESAKLIRHTENLRELSADMEAHVEKFRTESLKSAQTEINDLLERKEDLLGEVLALEKRKQAAQTPLDAEWEKLTRERAQVCKKELALEEEKDTLSQNALAQQNLSIELQEEKKRIAEQKKTTNKLLVQALHDREKARTNLLHSTKVNAEVIKWEEAKKKELIERENHVLNREQEAADMKDRVEAKDRELERERIFITDERQTLERDFAELKRKTQ